MNVIFDSHCLVGTDYWLSKNKPSLDFTNDLSVYETELKTISHMYRSIIMPFPSCRDGTYIPENDIVLNCGSEYPWTIPVLAFNPHSSESYRYVYEKLESGVAFGIVLWPILCRFDLDKLDRNKYFDSLLKRFHCCVTVHVGAGNEKTIGRVAQLNNYSPLDAVSLAEMYPDVKFILTHLLRISDSALERAKHLNNVIIDTSGLSTHKRWYEKGHNVFPSVDCKKFKELSPETILRQLMEDEALKDKLSFGTQYPFCGWYNYHLQDEVNMVLRAGLSEEAQNKLFYLNMAKFIGVQL